MADYDLSTYEGRQEARDAGYWVGTDNGGNVVAEYGYTGGQADQPMGGGGGGGSYSAPQYAPQTFDGAAFGNALRDATSPLFSQISGFERDRLKQENDQFLAQLQLERDKLERLGVPEIQIRQQLANLEMEHTRRMDALQEELGRGRLALDQELGRGQLELGRGQLGLGRGQLGLDYLSQAAGFAESDPFALSNFMRGAQSNPDVPMFVQNLRQNIGPQAAMGPTGQAGVPQPITMGSLGNAMAGVPRAFQPGANTDLTLGAIGDVVQRGPGSLAAGSLESLTQNEMNTLGSGIKHVAGSAAVPAFMEAYQRNPVRRQAASKPSVYQY